MRRLLLIGGGHANVQVLHALARAPIAGVETVLVSLHPRHHYSGMVPGYLQGRYEEADLAFDLRALAAAAGARFVEGEAERLEGATRRAVVGGAVLAFDAAAIDVGSASAGLDVPGVRAHARRVRPMTAALALREALDGIAAARASGPVHCVVAGAGAAGVEVAFALERRGVAAGARPKVCLVDAGRLLPEFAPRARRLAGRLLAARGIRLVEGRRVAAVREDAAVLDDGTRLPSDLTVWLVGAAPPPLVERSDLPKDPRGYFLVDDTLRSADGAPVWGAGDCVGLRGLPPLPKAGVYAVREGPVLAENLRAFFEERAPRAYRPQPRFLALLDTGRGEALLHRPPFVLHARWAGRLKERIDRAFVARFSQAPAGGAGAGTSSPNIRQSRKAKS